MTKVTFDSRSKYNIKSYKTIRKKRQREGAILYWGNRLRKRSKPLFYEEILGSNLITSIFKINTAKDKEGLKGVDLEVKL